MKQNWFIALIQFAEGQQLKFTLSILLSVASIVSGLVPYYCVYRLIDLFILNLATTSQVLLWCGWALVFYILKVVLFSLSTGLSHHVAFHVLEGLRKQLIQKFLNAPLGEVQKLSIGEIKNMLVDKTENIEPPLAHVVPEGAGHFVLPLISLIALCCIDWRLSVAALVTFPVAIVCMGLTFWISGESFQRYNESNAEMNSIIVEYVEGIEIIKAFGKAGVSYEKYSHAINEFKGFVIAWMASTWVTMKLAFAFFPSTLLGVLPVGLALANAGTISASQACLAVMLSMSMVTSLARLEVFTESARQMQATVEEITSYLSMESLPQKTEPVDLPSYDVVLSQVHFSYDQDHQEVLKGIDLMLPQSSFTALVGPSGSGKSTVAKLIARFWDVSEGEILIGGVNIKDIPLKQLSECVSFVTQDNFLFNCSILENIRVGNPCATNEQVIQAAQKAQCEEFILRLPQGYETSAGEAGNRLSGGEKQRIAIARMILKNAPIVILDEATAFTDPENEDKIQQSIGELAQGKTLLVIAHRLSTIKDADSIVVLDNGEIVAQGTQNELLDSCEIYSKMWDAHIGAKQWAVSTSENATATKRGM